MLAVTVSGLRRKSNKQEEAEEAQRSPTGALDMIGANARASGGRGVNIYIMNSGIRYTHSEFGGRAIAAYDATKWFSKVCSPSSSTCAVDGHQQHRGTQVASAAGGATYGVAPEATLLSVKVIKNDGGSSESLFLNGLSYVVSNAKAPAVVVMNSMIEWDRRGDQGRFNELMEIAASKGIVAVAGAGNAERSTCAWWPGTSPLAITVGSAEDSSIWKRIQKDDFSNYGRCTDMYAPGSNVYGACGYVPGQGDACSDSTLGYMRSRTGLSAGMVAGAAATLLSKDPNMAPAKVRQALETTALKDAVYIQEHLVEDGDPNLLLHF